MQKKARIALLVAVAALIAVVAGVSVIDLDEQPQIAEHAGNAPADNAEDLPVIKIGVDIKDPFVYIARDGSYAGIDADIAREACRRAGLSPKFVRISWNDRDDLLKKGTVDCLWCGYSWNSRADRYRWSDTYLTTTISILVRKDGPAKSIADLDGTRSVAVRAGSVSENKLVSGALGTSSATPVKAYGSVEMSEAAFVKGYADCWMSYTYLLDRLYAENPGTYRFLDRDTLTIDLAVAFDLDYDGPYLDRLDKAIDAMKRDGSIAKIEKKYAKSLPKAGDANDAE